MVTPHLPPIATPNGTIDRLNTLGIFIFAIGVMTGEGIALAGAGVCLLGLLAKERNLLRRHSKGFLALLLLWLFLFVSTTWAARPLRSGAPWSALHLALFPIALMSWQRLRVGTQNKVLGLLLILASVSAVLAVTQYFGLFQDSDLDVNNRVVSTHRVLEPATPGRFKAGGLHFHRLRYAHTLVPLGLAAVMSGWSRARQARQLGYLAFGCVAALLLTSLAMTFTRASWIALSVGISLLFISRGWTSRTRGIAALFLLSLGLLLPLALFSFGKPEDRSFAWHTSLRLFAAHPLLGTGYGGYTTAALQLLGGLHPMYPLLHIDAHSSWLQLLAEGGLLGTLLFVIAGAYFTALGGAVSAAQLAVLGSLMSLGIVHNLGFHPVVVAGAALAWAIAGTTSRPQAAQG